jgi:hypothetical protein
MGTFEGKEGKKQRKVKSMDIFNYMDCVDCDRYKHIPGRMDGEPEDCYPPEDICEEGAPGYGPCGRMLGVIEDMINDGQFETNSGFMATSTFLEDCTLEDIGFCEENKPMWWDNGTVDFSSAFYWFISYDPEIVPVPYADEEAVYEAFFE